MDGEFRYLDGADAGQVRIVRKEFATIGRHPDADLPFDPGRDLEVSVRHAAVFRAGGGWVVRDLGSTNGTWVNGEKVKGDRVLLAGDLIRLGREGPRLRFQLHDRQAATLPDEGAVTLSRSPERSEGPAKGRNPGGTTRIRAEVRRQTAGWKRVTALVAVGALLMSAGLGILAVRQQRSATELRVRLLERTDSLLANLAGASSSVAALADQLALAREETARLRAGIADRATGAGELDSLTGRLEADLPGRTAIVEAARFDRAAIDSANRDAVGVVVTELAGGRRIAGTGFVIRARGDTGWVLTARHLVTDSAGRPGARLGFLFEGSRQNFRARLLEVADSADLAVLVVRVAGGVPAVAGLGAAPHPGEPVALLGFPVGLDPGGTWRIEGVRAVGLTGTVRRAGPDLIEVDGYGASGSSGGPIFGADGKVVGMVFGGDPESDGRLVYAVTTTQITRLLEKLRIPYR
ncbi:MAG TPA: trypsin-like peptidase domain-containing protein [Gemmatimonadales bacterium]|nr:trypsin-like peptidase domain-containing protein [Gemmatimonadales bacterium]